METAFAILAGLFFAAAFYLLLARSLIRMMLGVVLLGNAVNLLIFVAGRLTRAAPPIISVGSQGTGLPMANPLPQALILTAIVIGFGLFIFLMVLAFRAYQSLDADDTDHLRLAEPDPDAPQPLDY